ncbi:unnamed protein product [Paramecium sonneborni]|uniref:WD40-repeat-containing domain n=1 Tax=Paramecium sonneborni TaxID=65129 RepID=A0A8S1RGH9_9CILI|nr:unnamed protein product [Paramecium sonneborni]
MFKPKPKEKMFLCEQHNKKIKQFQIERKKLFCKQCLVNNDQTMQTFSMQMIIELIEDNISEKLQTYSTAIEPLITQIYNLKKELQKFQSYILKQLAELTKILDDWITEFKQNGEEESKYSMKDELEKFFENVINEKQQHDWKEESVKISNLSGKINNNFIDKVQKILNNFQNFPTQYFQSNLTFIEKNSNNISEIYEKKGLSLVLFDDMYQKEPNLKVDFFSSDCRAMAINKDNDVLVFADGKLLKVMQLKDNRYKNQNSKFQGIENNQEITTTLNFYKSNNNLIQGSQDYTIRIWEPNDQFNIWTIMKHLKGHQHWISCLVLYSDDTFFISGSTDNTIRIWKLTEDKEFQILKEDHKKSIFGLSLNQNNDVLISCGADQYICVFTKTQEQQQWKKTQKIDLDKEQFGYRLCFINNDVFTFQPHEYNSCKNNQIKYNYIQIYEKKNLENNTFIFEKNNKIQIDIKIPESIQNCDFYFPQIYRQEILFNKYQQSIQLIQLNFEQQNNSNKIKDIKCIQQINFEQNGVYARIYGTISQDGKYLVLWDYKSKKIQIYSKCKMQ